MAYTIRSLLLTSLHVLAVCAATKCADQIHRACFSSQEGLIKVIPGLSQEGCCTECGMSTSCKAWQFIAAEGAAQSSCDLRSHVPAQHFSLKCVTSGTPPATPTPGPPPAVPTPSHPAPGPLSALPPIPGLHTTASREGALFGKGFDPTLGQARHSVLDYHYTNSSWRDWGQAESGLSFALPDEVFIYDIPASQLDNQENAFSNTSSYHAFEEKYHWSAVILFLFNSAKASADGSMRWLLEDSSRTMMLSEQYTTSFKVNLWEPSVLKQKMAPGAAQSQSAFAREQALLPATRTSEEDKESYRAFIQKFGTHYVHEAVYGSLLEMILSSSKELVGKMGVEWNAQVRAVLGWMLIGFFKLEASAAAKTEVSATFAADVNMLLSAYGGDVSTIASGDYAAWAETVQLNPAPVNVSYTSHHELFLDPVKAAHFQDAVKEYMHGDDSLYNLSSADAASVCAAPPGFNLSFADIPKPTTADRAIVEVDQVAAGDPAPLPQLLSSAVGKSFDVKRGIHVAVVRPWTYDQHKQWLSPYARTSYRLPDMTDLTIQASACLRFESSLVTNASAVVDAAAKITDAFLNMFIKLTDLARIRIHMNFLKEQADFSARLNAFAKAELSLSFKLALFKLTHAPTIPESGESSRLLQAVQALPAGASHEYDDFVSKYGTHYVHSEEFGGYCNFTCEFDARALASMSLEQQRQQATAKILLTYLRILRAPLARLKLISKDWNVKLSHKFDMHSHATFKCTGGDLSKLGTPAEPAPKGFNKWLKTLSKNPAPIHNSQKMRPLDDFLHDYHRRRLLREAILRRLNMSGDLDASAPAATASSSASDPAPATATKPPAAVPNPNATTTLVGVAAAKAQAKRAVVAVPGVCTGFGGAGVGCGYDATEIEAFGMTLNPKKPVVDMPPCKRECYEDPDDDDDQDPDCEYCTYANPFVPDKVYKVPSNVMIVDKTMAGGCFETKNFADTESYTYDHTEKWGHKGLLHSWSKTVRKFYHMYYRKDDSLSLSYKYNLWHQVALADLIPKPNWHFKQAAELLPLAYDKDAYRSFIVDYGTHVMDSAWMGGAALLTSYYHSCLLSQYRGEDVKSKTFSDFFLLFPHGHGSVAKSNISQSLWEEWSTVEMKLIGGAASKHGKLTRENTLSEKDCEEWEESIKHNGFVPLKYSLLPLSDFMLNAGMDKQKAANVQQGIDEHVGEAKAMSDELVNHLVPQDPYIKPDWCKFSPHPRPANPRQGFYSCSPLGKCAPDPFGTYAKDDCHGQCHKHKSHGRSNNPVGAARPGGQTTAATGYSDVPSCPPLPTKGDFMREVARRRRRRRRR